MSLFQNLEYIDLAIYSLENLDPLALLDRMRAACRTLSRAAVFRNGSLEYKLYAFDLERNKWMELDGSFSMVGFFRYQDYWYQQQLELARRK